MALYGREISVYICCNYGGWEEIMLSAQDQIYGCHPNRLGAMNLKLTVLEQKKNTLFSIDNTE